VPIGDFAVHVLRYYDARRSIHCTTQWLFIATSAVNPMQPHTMVKSVPL
jgi:hypothetical protein